MNMRRSPRRMTAELRLKSKTRVPGDRAGCADVRGRGVAGHGVRSWWPSRLRVCSVGLISSIWGRRDGSATYRPRLGCFKFERRVCGQPFRRYGLLDTNPGNLRPASTSFIGRDAELAEVQAALREHRVVTLTGVGGWARPDWHRKSRRAWPMNFPMVSGCSKRRSGHFGDRPVARAVSARPGGRREGPSVASRRGSRYRGPPRRGRNYRGKRRGDQGAPPLQCRAGVRRLAGSGGDPRHARKLCR
jgi:hypothetical protein